MEKLGEEMAELGEELQCIGSMEVQRTLNRTGDDSALGFICGSLPVPTAGVPQAFSSTAVVSQNKRVAPHYRLLPAETDLNAPLGISETDLSRTGKTVAQKCDALAASALSGQGDEIDVIAPVDILKQIFKTPYSKARVSVAVHRIGRTLILNSGPDEEHETLVSKKKHNVKLGDEKLYSKFIHHSMQSPQSSASTPHESPEAEAEEALSSPWQVTADEDEEPEEASDGNLCATLRLQSQHDGKISWGVSDQDQSSLEDDEAEEFGEQDAGTQKRSGDGFLRVLFWQFQNLRMLLGSDLLVFSNEKHVAVSLHLVEVKRQVSPLMWLDAWLDNIMASVPELAICYHNNGVVQGYELLKTDDIFTLKGLAKDGSVFFQPHVVQQNALSVLRFLQENCKHDPGTYWLFKSSGDDVLQLYDLTGVPKNRRKKEESSDSLPSSNSTNFYTLPLAMLLYRIAFGLSRSQESNDICKCAKLYRKCLEFLDDEEHLIIKAITHEQVARLILSCCKEHGSSTKPILLLESYEEEGADITISNHAEVEAAGDSIEPVCIEELPAAPDDGESSSEDKQLALCSVVKNPPHIDPEQVSDSDSVNARLAAVHHVSQAILSLRSQRQLQDCCAADDEKKKNQLGGKSKVKQFPLCLCGDIDCITFYDIHSSEFGALVDHKLRELVLMLGESYLALGESYCETGELSRAVKAAQLACSVYASVMPPGDARTPFGCQYCSPVITRKQPEKKLVPAKAGAQADLQKGLFWGQMWRLIGDLYIKNLMLISENSDSGYKESELQMAEEIVREVKRLRKKSGQKPGCGVCSSSDCSCHMDRTSSGSSATSSSDISPKTPPKPGQKLKKPGKEDVSASKHSADVERRPGDDESYQVCRNHVCFHLQKVLTRDLKLNFVAAVGCYDASIYSLTDVAGVSRQLEAAIRKKGWACNELARLILAAEDISLAETAYMTAARAFAAVGDLTNVVLVNCNLGYALRSGAEKMVAWLSVGSLTKEKYEKISREAEELYRKALRCYGAARTEMNGLLNPELREEVVAQLANTYFRLGSFVMSQQIAAVLSLETSSSSSSSSSSSPASEYKFQSLFTANSAMLEALVLYESVERSQEAAYTHYKIGCHLKQCLGIAKLKADYIGSNNNARLHAGIADRHLRKALSFYQAHTHPAMFLEIIREESELCFLSLSFTEKSYQLLDQAMSYLVEGWRAFDGAQQPPAKSSAVFLKALQAALRSVLSLAMTTSKSQPAAAAAGEVQAQVPAARVNNAAKLKEMYRISLRSSPTSLGSDLWDIHSLWVDLPVVAAAAGGS